VYGQLFLSDHWIELWEALAEAAAPGNNSSAACTDTAAIGAQIEDYLTRYLDVCPPSPPPSASPKP